MEIMLYKENLFLVKDSLISALCNIKSRLPSYRLRLESIFFIRTWRSLSFETALSALLLK